MRRVTFADVDQGRLSLHSSSVLVIDQNTGQTLFEKHSDAVVPIASISKLMTAMVVLDAKLDMQEVLTIGEEEVDSLKGTRSRIPVGTTMTRETAMLLALMSSENRAAHALGRHYPGGMPAFVVAMNNKARALGMRHPCRRHNRRIEPTNDDIADHRVDVPRPHRHRRQSSLRVLGMLRKHGTSNRNQRTAKTPHPATAHSGSGQRHNRCRAGWYRRRHWRARRRSRRRR